VHDGQILAVFRAGRLNSSYMNTHDDQAGRFSYAQRWPGNIFGDEISNREVVRKKVVVIEEADNLIPFCQ
jgi:hypothetical protein